MTLTWYKRARDSRAGYRIEVTAEELAANIRDAGPMRCAKQDLPLVCLSTFQGEHRGNERVESVYMLGLDIDTPQADPEACARLVASTLGDVEVFVYSTSSSAPGAFKLRVLIPYDVPASGDEHRMSWAMVARVLARVGVNIDRACCDPARGFYVWAIPENGAYFHLYIPGNAWPVAQAAETEGRLRLHEQAERERETSLRPRPRSSSTLDTFERARRYVERMPIAIEGANGSEATFNVARRLVADFKLDDASAMILLREHSARCRPPWSEKELAHKLASAKSARVRVEMDP